MRSLMLLAVILASSSTFAMDIPCKGAIHVIDMMERDLQINTSKDESKEVIERDEQLFQKLKSNMLQYCYQVDQQKNQQQQ